jgi:transcriptional regulator with XRE-family HTH domain
VLALRKRNGLTVDLLADRLGGGSRTLAKIEGGRR